MANINIYPEHRDVLDSLITSGRVASVAAGTKTGPFRDQRDAYVFAVSLALALGKFTPSEEIPTSKKGVTAIHDYVFLNADGAEQLVRAVALVDANQRSGSVEDALTDQLDMLSDARLSERIAVLDRYAHAGFEWLREHLKDESSIRDLVLMALDRVECMPGEPDKSTVVRDPLLDVLLS